MLENLYVHLPYRALGSYLPFILEHRLQPEIAFLAEDFSASLIPDLRALAGTLARAGLSVTVHAPFMDLNPGALDPLVRDITLRRYRQTLDAAAVLGAGIVVFHPGFDRWRYAGQGRLWVERNLRFWPELIPIAEAQETRMALENIFEEEPSTLAALVAELDSNWLGHCFDTGHWHLFSRIAMPSWLAMLGPRLYHLHLHDNLGDQDAHLPVGQGRIDFAELFAYLRGMAHFPSMTLEAHTPEGLMQSLTATAALLPK